MDANGTRYKLLLGPDDWGRCLDGQVELATRWAATTPPTEGTGWDDDRCELTLATSAWRFPRPTGEQPMTLDARRGAAMDRYGNWYWIDAPETGVLVTSSGTGQTTAFWPAPGPAPQGGRARPTGAEFGPVHETPAVCPARLRGLTVTEDHYLLVGTLDPGGLFAFDLRTGGPPMHVAWPPDVPFEPWQIAARPGGGAYVLDGPAGDRRVWRLDRHLMVEPLGSPVAPAVPGASTFGAAGEAAIAVQGSPAGGRAATIVASDAKELDGNPVDIGVAADDVLAVLDVRDGRTGSVVRLFDAHVNELAGSPHRLGGLRRALLAHAMAVVPDAADAPAGDAPAGVDAAGNGDARPLGEVVVVDRMGDQAYRFPLTLKPGPLRARSEYHPMRLFGGRALVATPRGVWYDCVDRWVPLVAQPRPQYAERALIATHVLDSQLPGCTWHRVLLDACIPSEASVRIWSAASDDRGAVETAPGWTPEPSPYRRGDGPERPFPTAPADPAYGTWELLLQSARGRYLRLQLELAGNRRTSPRIRALRAYYPRFSYLEQYLPHAYRDDVPSSSFLDGFLANIEGLFTSIEDRIAAAQLLFDARSAPAEALDWLASWFDLVMDPAWDEDRRRLLLRHAVDLFRHRGTPRGLRMALGLAIVACPGDGLFAPDAPEEPGGLRVIERYQSTRAPAAMFGDPTRAALPREASSMARWTPSDGSVTLHARYAAYLRDLAGRGLGASPDPADSRYPVTQPAAPWDAPWRSFSADVLGVVPSAGPADLERWQAFLARRYPTPAALAAAHRLHGARVVTSFDQVQLPASLPSDGSPLADWFAFESIVLRGVRVAHRFSVLLPVPTGGSARRTVRGADTRDRRAAQDRVARLVELEKPAHTVFDIRSYWLAFRLGEARLGKDTRLDLGSRSPDLTPPAVLGSMYLGEGVLTSTMADVPARPVVFSGSVDAATRRIARRTDG